MKCISFYNNIVDILYGPRSASTTKNSVAHNNSKTMYTFIVMSQYAS